MPPAAAGAEAGERRDERRAMVRLQLERRGISDRRVLHAMEEVPRHCFVPDTLSSQAYDDGPLCIESGQTISQPYMVARMSEELALTDRARVLEIGTGSGYQSAVLSLLAGEVFSMERDRALAVAAARRLARLGYGAVRCRHGDGREGWVEEAPFDAILVAAASRDRPARLLEQLADGGRMILPLEDDRGGQRLHRLQRCGDGWEDSPLTGVRFVPLLHGLA